VKNPDALSGPSLSCFPHSGHKQEEKYPAVLIIVNYLFLRYPSSGGEIPESLSKMWFPVKRIQ
jgi:hypothetical protein